MAHRWRGALPRAGYWQASGLRPLHESFGCRSGVAGQRPANRRHGAEPRAIGMLMARGRGLQSPRYLNKLATKENATTTPSSASTR